jgi:microcompartment protein CcmL/EutN
MPNRPALGLIETRGLVPAIEATDAAVKAAKVNVISVEVTVAAMVTVKLEGDLGAVQAAVEAGAAAAQKIGELIAAHVIPRPDDEMDHILEGPAYSNPMAPKGSGKPTVPLVIPDDDAILDDMTVVDLRRLVREQPDFPLAGREISHANKDELLKLLRDYRDRSDQE